MTQTTDIQLDILQGSLKSRHLCRFQLIINSNMHLWQQRITSVFCYHIVLQAQPKECKDAFQVSISPSGTQDSDPVELQVPSQTSLRAVGGFVPARISWVGLTSQRTSTYQDPGFCTTTLNCILTNAMLFF